MTKLKMPEPAAWLLDGEAYVVKQCRLLGKKPGEEIPGQKPLYTSQALKDVLEQAAKACDVAGRESKQTAATLKDFGERLVAAGAAAQVEKLSGVIRKMIGEIK